MSSVLDAAKAAAASAAVSGNICPINEQLHMKYHAPDICQSKPSRPMVGHDERGLIYAKLLAGGVGAALVPETQTIFCPIDKPVSLEEPLSVKGFDTTWIVENTSENAVLLAWVVNGVEFSPFLPDVPPMNDPKAMLLPGDWISVPTFESFVYHVRAIDKEGNPGDVVLQHRAGMIPLGRKNGAPADENSIDPEPFSPDRVGTVDHPNPVVQEAGRKGTQLRPCNTVDIGFRNYAAFPLSVFWASHLDLVPEVGFTCAEKYKFHMGTMDAPQDFMWDWGSKSKYEGSFMGQTFVARRADDPSVVVDSYTLQPTRIIDCPKKKKKKQHVKAQVPAQNGVARDVGDAQGSGSNADLIGADMACALD